MKSSSNSRFIVVVSVVLAAGAAGAVAEWRETESLRARLDALKTAPGKLLRLQDENQRLRALQVSVAELERLRADHAALPRLRAEIEALKKRP